jgi:(1->4)-alpha-D-glucan 1-alpha-D-glucosylmutase
VENRTDGGIKLDITRRILQLRREHPALFTQGGYTPLRASGPAADNVIAFMREHDSTALVVVAPRLLYTLAGTTPIFGNPALWDGTSIQLPSGTDVSGWSNLLDGSAVDGPADLSSLFTHLPIALLTWQGDPS